MKKRTKKKPDWKKITPSGLYPSAASWIDRNPLDEKEIAICGEWIDQFCYPSERINSRKGSSYGLKHDVERWAEKNRLGRQLDGGYIDHHICNGAFIEAARRRGYEIERDSPGSLNAFFNMKFLKNASP